ncbi:ATP-dependent DNA helicase Rep [Paenibacillus solanacearum]|uniref:ATP-dependent DNA helicase Rep n=2 Tax=Paenibacillus solanacearum TaxID=2048548 RepID=A0A916K7N7_9BACL|nr:ATP-dependent DNA helicase Rep [Paenibacillus solanacearum]
MINKMILELDKITDHRTIAAITFTVKATKEIRLRASKKIKKHYVVMTNDSFIEQEIVRPFIKDALGEEFYGDFSVEYGGDYKFQDFNSGLKQLKENKILGSYRSNHFNFKFELALKVLLNSVAAQEYIKSKYAVIFLDEYQDSDKNMHQFFMYLKNILGLKLFIVGDGKQAIYHWRGAMEDVFKVLSKENFNMYELSKNFRCDAEIENYANLLHNVKYFLQPSIVAQNVIFKKYIDEGFVNFSSNFYALVSSNLINLNKEITIIANINDEAKTIADKLNEAGYDFIFIPKTPLDDGLPNGILLKELALYCKNELYSVYDFIENTGIDEGTRIEVNKIISGLKKNPSNNKVKIILPRLAEYLDFSFTDDEVDKFYESISNVKYDMAFELSEKKHKVMTVFAAKGLEFDQVISLSRYYRLHQGEHIQNHYVCITRAKEKFVMFVERKEYFNYVSNIAKHNNNDVKKLVMCIS